MSQQRIFNLWEEARSTKPMHRDTFKSMYLRALQNAQRNSPNEQLSVIRHQTQDFILFESKLNHSTNANIFVYKKPRYGDDETSINR